ncbi:MAG: type II toxin-antitoxin system RelE/ParE family toxin [Nitrospirae bacterium]|nr:type II toxin-antitoxin system RelE/ParE family toxin [Nitrospirota bacterium]MCL5977482.1 type II toxin-antitoxin system RelE/ParE family toxin [Nitrospirota bacterium]
MRLRVSKQAEKFLFNSTDATREKIRMKIKRLVLSAGEQGIIPFKELQIKSLEGEWKGFMRMKIGGIRVIFRIDRTAGEIFVYEIDYRGGAYK